NIRAARGVPVPCRLHEGLGWRYDLDELARTITPRTRAVYVNSPHNPTGGVLTREDVRVIAELCRDRNLWLISDEAYEDVLFDAGIGDSAAGIVTGAAPKGAFYAFLKIDPAWRPERMPESGSLSWAMAEFLIAGARIGCVPGVDFGQNGEGYVRFCFARDRAELTGALESMRSVFAANTAADR